MNKKLISIVFFIAILLISCSNEDKTGPSSSSTTNSDLASTYSGTWTFTGTYFGATKETLTINTDGSCIIDNIKAETITKNSDNNYILLFKNIDEQNATYTATLDITFNTVNSGTVKGNQKVVLADGTTIKDENFNETIEKNN